MERGEAHFVARGRIRHLLVTQRKPFRLRTRGAGAEQTDLDQRLQILVGDREEEPWVARRKDADLLSHRNRGKGWEEDERFFLQKAETTYETRKAKAAKVMVRSLYLGRLYIGMGEATKV
jgi:hypothetical protein